MNDLTAEKSIINQLLNDKDFLFEAITRLTLLDFTDITCQKVFTRADKAVKKNKPFSLMSLPETLRIKVVKLTADVIDYTSNGSIEAIQQASYRRKVATVSQQISALSQDGDIEELKAKATELFDSGEDTTVETLSPSSAEASYLEILKNRKTNKTTACSLEFRQLQESTLGFSPGEMIVVAARPSVGKTALLENMAYFQARKGKKVLFVSAEMTAQSIIDRQVCRLADISFGKLREGISETDPDYAKVQRALEKRKNFTILDAGSITINLIRSKIHRLKITEGLDIVYVDYLQKITGEGKSEYERVSRISNGLKALALDFNIPIVSACQYNRVADGRKPKLSDLRDSGQIEQDCDVVISLWPEDTEEVSGKKKINVDLLKSRNGRTWSNGYQLWFKGSRFSFHEILNIPVDIPQLINYKED